jgi:hypothetical protein
MEWGYQGDMEGDEGGKEGGVGEKYWGFQVSLEPRAGVRIKWDNWLMVVFRWIN